MSCQTRHSARQQTPTPSPAPKNRTSESRAVTQAEARGHGGVLGTQSHDGPLLTTAIPSPLPGLHNASQMCYLNVILQTLSSIPLARSALLEGSAGPEKPIHHQLSRILHALRFQHGGMVDATALFAALRWSTHQQGDCAAALLALIDRLKIEAQSPTAFDVFDRLTTTSIMSTVRRNDDPD